MVVVGLFLTFNGVSNAFLRPNVEELLEHIREGRCVQMLHVGPYDAERASFEAMARAAAGAGYTLEAPHHEVYFSDPRRVPPARLRTLLRCPVKRSARH